ncbi:MAG TPA: phosphatase PAP2 family protein [Stellaceae bacterium]|nr:phosphatase PAP2 family protein [Stellaceae bacterium]
MRFLLHAVTDLGDSALLLPASAFLVAYLLYFSTARVVRIWVSTLALCAFLTLFLKVAFFTCGSAIPAWDLHSPSGHTSLSMTFYGCGALMVSGDKGRATQIGMLAAGTLLVIAVAISRVLLHAHTPTEAMLGLCVGVLCVSWFGRRFLALPPLSLPWRWALAVVALLALVTHGAHWDFEWAVARIAAFLHSAAPICA